MSTAMDWIAITAGLIALMPFSAVIVVIAWEWQTARREEWKWRKYWERNNGGIDENRD